MSLWLAVDVGNEAAAVEIEKLVMPGPVIAGHAEYESDCGSCHQAFSKTAQRELCLDCHDEVAGDIGSRTGFHGRAADARDDACVSCHSEHRGRDADIVGLDPDVFDHALTDMPLEGRHTLAACSGCHAGDQKFREAPSACIDCHEADDTHRGELGRECADCHEPAGWQKTRFDHAEQTDFALLGAHAQAPCAACHVSGKYEGTPSECVDCHRIDDVHGGSNGAACADCHDVQSWSDSTFDHARETGFALAGGHAQLACAACHTDPATKAGLDDQCVSCHRSDDAHRGLLGEACETCHTAAQWTRANFDHAEAADFPLVGRHAELTCQACHKVAVQQDELARECIGCHRADDVHAGSEGEQCESCHRSTAWTEVANFDHDFTAFPLVGMHAAVPCEACHTTRQFDAAPTDCTDCHAKDDSHAGALGQACARCHTPNDWRLWLFDHATATRFPLDGAHGELACADCHREAVAASPKLAMECVACHRADDPHRGEFGSDCARCHGTRSFSSLRREAL